MLVKFEITHTHTNRTKLCVSLSNPVSNLEKEKVVQTGNLQLYPFQYLIISLKPPTDTVELQLFFLKIP